MTIRATLGAMLQGLRAELGESMNPNQSGNTDAAYAEKLARMQRQLWFDHAWTHLRKRSLKPLQAGQRYYDWPAEVSLDRVENVDCRWSARWHPVFRGIGPEEFNAFDSDADVRLDPVMKWEPYGQEQFEVWPVPASNTGQILIRGIAPLVPLVDVGDFSTLDGDLLVLHVAAEIATDRGNRNAPLMQRRAAQHYAKLRQRAEHNDDGRLSMLGDTRPGPTRRTPVVTAVAPLLPP